MKVTVIGAGIGGLVCALACAQEELDVTVLERAPALAPIGAGIQLPPNASRVARQLGLLPKLIEKGIVLDSIEYLRYKNGKLLFKIEGGQKVVQNFGDIWLVISRPNYHDVLWNAAREAGVKLRLGAEVDSIDFSTTSVQLKTGERVTADVIVGADGLWSCSRDQLLGRASPPSETGDLAYRATISRERLQALNDSRIDDLMGEKGAKCWMGHNKHCVFYPVAGGELFNLVLLRPDDLSKNIRQASGDLDEMRACFEGWDERLTKMISCVTSVLKWKLCHHEELERWTKGSVVLLGDACHPTLPYLAQGAAMASEDGAVLGNLLSRLERSGLLIRDRQAQIQKVLKLYETLRKSRTTTIVKGARSNRISYHLPDGPLQEARDASLPPLGEFNSSPGTLFANWDYMHSILAFDSVGASTRTFEKWSTEERTKL